MPEGGSLGNLNISLDSVLSKARRTRQTKVVCTLGPACWSKAKLTDMIKAGMNVARFNFSHGDHPSHERVLRDLREAARELGSNVATLLDTKGPEIRTGFLKNKRAELKEGSLIEITTDYDFKGDESKFACSYKSLPTSVRVGTVILVADGSLTMEVVEIKSDSIVVKMLNGGLLEERKNMNLPGIKVDLPTISPKDREDLVDFAVKHRMDFVAASFIRKGSDIDVIRKVLGEAGKSIQIIAKIENQEGIENFDEIIQRADGVMVARGDMGMEIPFEKVFLAQKLLIRRANVLGKTVITATQMLESMIANPRPTRAECTDVANAVLDGTDCVMLSGETAKGEYPVQALRTMSSICAEAESAIDYDKLYLGTRYAVLRRVPEHAALGVREAVASSAVRISQDVRAKLVVVLTQSGSTARLVAKYRPSVPIVVMTESATVARQCEGVLRGVRAFLVQSILGTDSLLLSACNHGIQNGWVKEGDLIVAVHGNREGLVSADMLKIKMFRAEVSPDALPFRESLSPHQLGTKL